MSGNHAGGGWGAVLREPLEEEEEAISKPTLTENLWLERMARLLQPSQNNGVLSPDKETTPVGK